MDDTALRLQAEDGVRALLALAGDDPTRPGLERTPTRVVDALIEMTAGPGKPADLLSVVFNEPDCDEMITVGPVAFTSVCEHHLLPFTGHAWMAYIPTAGRVVGVSKLVRLVEHHARQLQTQERLTGSVADDVNTHLTPHGVGVAATAEHACMTTRGVRKPGAGMTTSALRGVFRDNSDTRREFLSSIRLP